MFERYMNKPIPPDGKAYIKPNEKTGELWVHCPWCGKRAFPIDEKTRISHMFFKCKGSNCKLMFEINA